MSGESDHGGIDIDPVVDVKGDAASDERTSCYSVAIDGASATVLARARLFRNLIVFVALASLAAVVLAAASGSPRPLAALLILLPMCGLFAHLDARYVDRWRAGVTAAWVSGEVELSALRAAVEAIPSLPLETVTGMLDTLPPSGSDGDSYASMRGAVARTMDAIASSRRRFVAWRTLCRTAVACGVLSLLFAGAWGWLPILLGVSADRLARPLVARTLSRRVARIVADVRREPGFRVERFVTLVDGLDWHPASSLEKERLLSAFRTSPARSV